VLTSAGPGGRLRLLRRLGVAFRVGTTAVAAGVVGLVVALVVVLASGAGPAVAHFGGRFFTDSALATVPVLAGTLLSSGLALLLAIPVAFGVAIFAGEVAPRWLRLPLAYAVDLGATIPSVVYGFWALEVLVPWLRTTVEPDLARTTGGHGPFSGLPLGTDFLAASVVLAVMIVPTISALAREALLSVPRSRREAALALGATRWDATRIAVLGPASPGLVAAVMLGLGRAIGETIAVALVIGNNYVLPTSLFSPGGTIPSLIVVRFPDATGLQLSALIELGLLLFALSFAINLGARLLIRKLEAGPGPSQGRPRPTSRPTALGTETDDEVPTTAPGTPPAWWARAVRRRDAAVRARRWRQRVVLALLVAAVLAAVLPLVSLVATAVGQGGSAVATPSFYTSAAPPFCLKVNASTHCPLGGIGPAIEGTLILLGLASLLGIPVGLFTGIYLTEYGRNRFGAVLGLLVDVMVGIPSILLGVFVFAVFLRYDRFDAQSALAGSIALAILMVPIVARATEAALRTVPPHLREAALALGFPRHRVTTRIVLGNSRSALVTGILLALGRAGGETAALVLTAGTSGYWFAGLNAPIAALGPLIYNNLTINIAPNWTVDAWGAALVLLIIMAAVSLAARLSLRTAESPGAE
jgi:phosphate transport system permease protein